MTANPPLPHTNHLWPVRLIGLALVLVLLANCSAAPASTDPVVRIGIVAPFEGRQREIGYDLIYAARLAVREWNAKGGIGDYRLELIALDDGGDPSIAIRAAQTLAIDPLVMGAVGHWQSETTTAASPIYQRATLALIAMDGSTLEPVTLPTTFAADYQAVAPFGESPGSYAGPAYQACNRLVEAIGAAIESEGRPTRAGVAAALASATP